MARLLTALAAVAALLALPPSAPAAEPGEAALPEPARTFVLGNLQFLLVHEVAHLVIGELQVPVLGPEENAADYIAAAALIRADRRDAAGGARNQAYLLAAADAQRRAWERGTERKAPVPYWDSHALTIQRYFQIACLLYGSDPVTYASLPQRIGLPPERAAGCATEFARADRGIAWLLATYGRKPGEPASAALSVRYEAPTTRVAADVAAAMREAQLVEAVVARINELFRLPRPAAVVMRRCGRAEAAWQPAQQELTICYELAELLYRMAPRG